MLQRPAYAEGGRSGGSGGSYGGMSNSQDEAGFDHQKNACSVHLNCSVIGTHTIYLALHEDHPTLWHHEDEPEIYLCGCQP